MPRFTVPFTVTADGEFTVEADDVEAARALVAGKDIIVFLKHAAKVDVEVLPADACSETPDAPLSDTELIQFGIVPDLRMPQEDAVKAACQVLADNGFPVTGTPEVLDGSPDAVVVLLNVGGCFWELLEEEGSLEFSGHGVTVDAEMP